MPDDTRYDKAIAAWRSDPAGYWLGAARDIAWRWAPETAFRLRPNGMADWFADGVLNITESALDRHVADGRGAQTALIWESPASGEAARYSYADLLDAVARCAGAFASLGVTRGDRVLITMPPVPETVIAMLACARLGAVHVVAFAGFAGPELASRIDDARPRLIVTATCCYTGKRPTALLPSVTEALLRADHKPDACLLLQRAGAPATPLPIPVHDFATTVAGAAPLGAVPLPATYPLYILHTSGTTGAPKGVLRDQGGHAVALMRSMRDVYDMKPGEVFFSTADLGWVVGHSYGVYAPLLAGCTSLLYEGSATATPDAGTIWRLAARHKARILFTAPSLLRALRASDPDGLHPARADLSNLAAIFVAGERAETPLLDWARDVTGLPVHDHWWQTETGSAIAGSLRGFGIVAAQGIGRALPGADLCVLSPEGETLAPDEEGELALRLPLPPGCLTTLWQAEARMEQTYLDRFPGFYRTFDHGLISADGEVKVLARLDDVLKVAGRRISTGRIEEVLARHPSVIECAVTARPDGQRGEVPVAYIVRRDDAISENTLRVTLIAAVRDEIGALATLRQIVFLDELPRTRSGKVLRRLLAEQPAA
ncbi:AMP-binding protein [Acidisoma cellulosilytica]|uniref:AMP-binding protein n=1 Tax=Acidisoma cellulosilyticum TaxID=2802395 RepID=A0A963Z0K1_9PROT|nr:AMP-binding protein [Acidisoma cellulosilyticum]MCB8879792.1 AMP-binding protein [Acidisoma cellulosilyticum]